MSKLKLNFFILATIVFWSSAYVGIREGLTSYSPGSLALLRFFVASICMVVIYYKWGVRQKLNAAQIVWIVFLGAIGFSFYHVALNTGEITVSSGIACFIISQVPVITTLLAMFFLKERLLFRGWIGTAISFAGITLIAFGNQINEHFDRNILFLILAAVAGSAYSVFQKPLLKNIHPVNFATFALWAGTAFLLFYAPDLIKELPKASFDATFAAIYIGIFPAAIAYLFWSMVLKAMPTSKASSYLYLSPPLAILLGWLILNEKPGIVAVIGGLLALGGAFLVHRGVEQKSKVLGAQGTE